MFVCLSFRARKLLWSFCAHNNILQRAHNNIYAACLDPVRIIAEQLAKGKFGALRPRWSARLLLCCVQSSKTWAMVSIGLKWNFNRANFPELDRRIRVTNWECLSEADVETGYLHFSNTLFSILSDCIPRARSSQARRNIYMTSRALQLKRQKLHFGRHTDAPWIQLTWQDTRSVGIDSGASLDSWGNFLNLVSFPTSRPIQRPFGNTLTQGSRWNLG